MNSTPRVVVQVNGKMVEFDLRDDHNSSYRVLSEAEAAEHFLLVKPPTTEDDHLHAEINQLVGDVASKLKDTFKNNLQSTVLNMLGFSNRWNSGSYEVDSSNKTSVIASMIAQQMKDFIAAEVVNPAAVITPKETSQMIAASKKEFYKNYEYQVRQLVHREMEKQLVTVVSKLVAELLSHQEIEIKKSVASVLSQTRMKR